MPARPFNSLGGTDSQELPDSGLNATTDDVQFDALQRSKKERVLGRLNSMQHRIGRGWRRKESDEALQKRSKEGSDPMQQQSKDSARVPEEKHIREEPAVKRRSFISRSLSQRRRVVPELPRPLTFARQNSERRDRLEPVEVSPVDRRRAYSEDRRLATARRRSRSPVPNFPSLPLAFNLQPLQEGVSLGRKPPAALGEIDLLHDLRDDDRLPGVEDFLPIDPNNVEDNHSVRSLDDVLDVAEREQLQRELESKWILNISMHFRDGSDREKFFVTYAQEPKLWRRVTISCDYRRAEPGSLEYDLRSLHHQRDKSMRIYEEIRESLREIAFFSTVTNLKLETSEDGQLHVHVTEDVNEVVSFPAISLVDHIDCRRYCENEVEFDAHLSGFVYRVNVHGERMIKKEIPGPDTTDEFLYEVNALSSLSGAESVIQLHGLVTDNEGEVIKALLISYASKGTLSDILYHEKHTDALPLERRLKWARQIACGLSEIHEAGFVQGDFTVSNVVVDEKDDAQIIDINRRGCPVGWEPPELQAPIEHGQRIGLMISVKTDLFQLGMVLWALAEKFDEPERVERPLYEYEDPDPSIPAWYNRLVRSLLSDAPQDRRSAKEVFRLFDEHQGYDLPGVQILDATVDRDDIEAMPRGRRDTDTSRWTSAYSLIQDVPPSTTDYRNVPDYYHNDTGAYVAGRQRGRSRRSVPRGPSPHGRRVSSNTSPSVSLRSRSRDSDASGAAYRRRKAQARAPSEVSGRSADASDESEDDVKSIPSTSDTREHNPQQGTMTRYNRSPANSDRANQHFDTNTELPETNGTTTLPAKDISRRYLSIGAPRLRRTEARRSWSLPPSTTSHTDPNEHSNNNNDDDDDDEYHEVHEQQLEHHQSRNHEHSRRAHESISATRAIHESIHARNLQLS